MRGQNRKNILALTLLAGIGGGVAPPLLFILALIVNSTRIPTFYVVLMFAAVLGIGVGLAVAACVSFLFWLTNKLAGSQQTTVNRLSLYASPICSFIISFLLHGAWILNSLSGGVVAHG